MSTTLKQRPNVYPHQQNRPARQTANKKAEDGPKFTRQVQAAAGRSGVYVPQQYTTDLLLFLSCAMRPELTGQARMFLVEGEPGTGKTCTTRMVLAAAGIHVIDLEVALLESPNAGLPAQYFAQHIDKASEHVEEYGVPTAVMVDDFDLLTSENTESSTGTRNTAQLVAAVQRYCDEPTMIVGKPCHPIPILATVNDLSGLRESFVRGGRAQRHHFNPEGKDLCKMAYAVLTPFLKTEQIDRVLRSAKGWRIAQFRDLAGRLQQHQLNNQCAAVSLERLFDLDRPHPSHSSCRSVSQETLASCFRAVEAGRKRASYLA